MSESRAIQGNVIASDYAAFLTELKGRIRTGRLQAGRAVNRELVLLYWDIGRGIVEKQQTAGWGEAVVERLAADLRAEFAELQGFSSFNVWRMRQIYLEYTSAEFLAQAAPVLEKESRKFLAQPVPEIASASKSSRFERNRNSRTSGARIGRSGAVGASRGALEKG